MSTYRVAYRAKSGKIEFNDYQDLESLLQAHEQIGVEEDSYTMGLHGEPVLRGLIGPSPRESPSFAMRLPKSSRP